MEFLVIHEVKFELRVDAPSVREAERLAAETPYSQWEERYVVREECVPLGESPVNPSGY